MDMLLLLLLIVGLAVVIVLSAIKSIKDDCDCEIRKVEQRYARLHESKVQDLEQEYKERQQKIYYEQREKILQEESEQIKAQAKANYQEYYDSLIAAAEAETALKIQNLNATVRKESEAAAQYHAEFEAKRAELDAEIADLRRRKDAAIEIVKQEEAVKRQQEFYSLRLTSDDKSDIIIIENLSGQIKRRAPLRKLIWSEYYTRPFGEMADRVLGKTKRCGIYKITESDTGRVYIGQSTDIRTRWSNHLKTIIGTDGGAARTRFHDYVAEKGIEYFTFELVEECAKDQLNEREKFYIELYRANDWGFNSTGGNK
jgi:hypothetical protein